MKTSGASFPCDQVILQKWSDLGYAWKRGESIVRAWVEIRGEIVQAIDNIWRKKPQKTDKESEERKCWGREFQMLGAAKEKDLRPISDRISSTMRRFLLEYVRWRSVRCIKSKIYAGCWNFKCGTGNLKFNTGRNWQPMKLVKHWRNMIQNSFIILN